MNSTPAVSKLSALASVITFALVLAGVITIPVIFTTSAIHFIEYPRQALVVGLFLTLLFLWSIRCLLRSKLTMTRSPLGVPLVLLLLAYLLSTWFSISRIPSLIGGLGMGQGGLVALLALVGWYFILLDLLNNKRLVGHFRNALLAVGFIIALVALVGYTDQTILGIAFGGRAGAFLEQMRGNLLGTTDSLVIFLLALLPLYVDWVRRQVKSGSWLKGVRVGGAIIVSLAPLAVVVMGLLSLLVPGIGFDFVKEIKLGFRESWMIALSVLRDRPFLGSGPATFFVDAILYKPRQLNLTDLWGTRLTSSYNVYFNLIATLGLAGLVAMGAFLWKFIALAREVLTEKASRVRVSYIVSLLVILVGWAFTPAYLTVAWLLLTLAALWMAEEKIAGSGLVHQVGLGLATLRERLGNGNGQEEEQAIPSFSQALPWIVVLLCAGFSLGGGYFLARDIRSNTAYTRSLHLIAEGGSGVAIYDAQREAITRNPYRAEYRRAYALTNLGLATSLLSQPEASEAQRQEAVNLVQQAIREARLVSEAINPWDVQNWILRAQVYRQLVGVAEGASEWTIESYRNALRLDPENAALYVDLGGMYYSLGQLDLAEQTFRAATVAKPDFANAHFNLAVALRDLGRYEQSYREFDLTEMILGGNLTSADQEQLDRERGKLAELMAEKSNQPLEPAQPAVTSAPSPVIAPVTPVEEATESAVAD